MDATRVHRQGARSGGSRSGAREPRPERVVQWGGPHMACLPPRRLVESQAQEWLSHSDPATTLRHYVRLTTAARAKALAGLDEVTRAALGAAEEKVADDARPLLDNVVALICQQRRWELHLGPPTQGNSALNASGPVGDPVGGQQCAVSVRSSRIWQPAGGPIRLAYISSRTLRSKLRTCSRATFSAASPSPRQMAWSRACWSSTTSSRRGMSTG